MGSCSVSCIFPLLVLGLCGLLRPLPSAEHSIVVHNNHVDRTRHCLLRVKDSVGDPDGFLKSWSDGSSNSPCQWTGVVCEGDNGNALVVGLNLSNMGLTKVQNLPADMCGSRGLSNLTSIDLSFNLLQGQFPSALLQCKHLQYINLSGNLYVGSLPSSLYQLQALQVLDVSYNNFSGSIPEGFGKLLRLRILNLYANLLNATIPAHIGSLQNLEYLRLAYNPFMPGPIPSELGNLTNLQYMWLAKCNLIGTIPPSLGSLIQLRNLDLSQNMLAGSIPSSIFDLPNLYQLELYRNDLEGSIPDNIGNLTSIANIDVSENRLKNMLPSKLANLRKLESLHLNRNNLCGLISQDIALLPALTDISLFSNSFSGSIPANLGRASNLRLLDVTSNNLSGPLPAHLCDGGHLEVLITMNNRFNGPIPQHYSNCTKLQRMRMGANMLTGHVPGEVWGLPDLYILELANNYLAGNIGPTIAKATNLAALRLQNNFFSGSLPAELGNLTNLTVELSLSHNQFTGTLPKELGNLHRLNFIYLSYNSFSGKIPAELSLCKQLTILDLSHNHFSGPIPESLVKLPFFTLIDLSFNNISGRIPSSMYMIASRSPCTFNLSYNSLSGEVPSTTNNSSCFVGNAGMCGKKFMGMKECTRHSKMMEAMLTGMIITAFVLLFMGSFTLYKLYGPLTCHWFHKFRKTNAWTLTAFHKIDFNEDDILRSLDEDSVIGSGGAGKVYRSVLKNGQVVAVKKLWSTNKVCIESEHAYGQRAHGVIPVDNGFKAEVTTLGKIRHKNIVKLLCCCTSENTKLLVYEYMPNGSLGDILHGRGHNCKPGFCLDWDSRYKIALGAAQGLAYLHHDCSPPIIHRDVKSNNILLDGELNAYVADFGIAKKIPESISRLDSSGDIDRNSARGSFASLSPSIAVDKISASGLDTVSGSNQRPDGRNRLPLLPDLQLQQEQNTLLLQSFCIAGSYSYIAPEHAYTSKVTEKSDIYSFGVVLLELVTGKAPVDEDVYGEGRDIVRWVWETLSKGQVNNSSEDSVRETLDARVAHGAAREQMIEVLRIALLCTSTLPSRRPSMLQVLDMLLLARPSSRRKGSN